MTDNQPTLDAPVEGEVLGVNDVPEGHVKVRLITELGEADLVVPPREKWRSVARSRLANGDDFGWAALTLSNDDAQAWMDLDPTTSEAEEFFERFNKVAPVLNRAERRAKQRGHLRAAS